MDPHNIVGNVTILEEQDSDGEGNGQSLVATQGEATKKKKKEPQNKLIYACDYCRTMKRRCIRLEHENPPRCRACALRKIDCIFTPRKKRAKKNRPPQLTENAAFITGDPAVGHPIILDTSGIAETSTGNRLNRYELVGSLSAHLLEEAFRYYPFRVVTDLLYTHFPTEFENRGRDPSNFGRWGELLCSILLADGARTSTHSSILQMDVLERPVLQGCEISYVALK
ncbi:hypothetical protein BT69DRAFT_789586 [Atractiella rhizophila]|nr:hypothetical protein BT69DRAFT_789586 [Atractiella rhizophila]